MEQDKQNLLEMIDRPAFVVKDNIITDANQAAKNRQISVESPIGKFLGEHMDAYQAYQDGVLHLSLEIGYAKCGAMVIRQSDSDIFLMDRDSDYEQLQTLSLASQQLRGPLSDIMSVSDVLFPELTDPDQIAKAATLRRSYFQMMRLICNMADAERYALLDLASFEKTELCSFFREIVEQAKTSLSKTGISLQYHCPEKPIFTQIHRESILRAVYNLISNAIKFSSANSRVDISLSCTQQMASLTVVDQGEGIADHVRAGLFHRYLREPAIEDTRFGLGLGITLVRSVASSHGGTVLLEEREGTRVTMTMRVRKDPPGLLRSPRLSLSDYTGGHAMDLLEFSEALPASAYKTEL